MKNSSTNKNQILLRIDAVAPGCHSRTSFMPPLVCKNIPFRTTRGDHGTGTEEFSESFRSGEITGFCGGRDFAPLLNALGMIERPSSGTLSVLGEDVLAIEQKAAWRLRDRAFGYLFTHHHLMKLLEFQLMVLVNGILSQLRNVIQMVLMKLKQ